ncbi:MAG: STAS/SEC14 domain-containing protein [Bacteroidia bacterium]
MEKLIFDKSYLSIFYDDDEKLIHLRWKKLATPEEFREGLNFALSKVVENKIERWLANLRDMSVIREAERKWTNEEWFPRLVKTGLRKMAIVNSLDYLNQSSVTKIMTHAGNIINFETHYFTDAENARAWLVSS